MATPYLPAADRYDRPALYRRCGRSGVKLPLISLGLWHNFGDVDVFATGRAIVRRAFDLGITHFDLANNYGPPAGAAETQLGALLKNTFGAWRDELVIATNPTMSGEATALFLADRVRDRLKVTRLASGLPVGADLEHADELTLGRAYLGRREI